MKAYLLPKGAVPLDAVDPTEDALPYDHVLAVALEGAGEILAASELSFYYISVPDNRFLARSQLYYLLTAREAAGSPLLSSLRDAVRGVDEAERPYVAASLLSESLPYAVFSGLVSGAEWRTPEELTRFLATAGRAYLRSVGGCRVEGFEEEARRAMATFAEVLEFLGVRARYGVDENGDFCLAVGGSALALSAYLTASVGG